MALTLSAICSFTNQNLGIHQISQLLPEICSRAEVARRTNHGMRRTSISAMFTMRLPEKEIQRRTRHKSIEALREYIQ